MPDLEKTEAAATPELKAARSWYDSFFTQLLAPLIATRYAWLAIEDINPRDLLDKKSSLQKTKPELFAAGAKPWKEPSFGRYVSRNFAALGMGATFLGVVGLYSKNTLHDIKSMYAEAVGYELDKKPEDVTLHDIFMKSENKAVAVTRAAYTRRTLMRAAAAGSFFMPWHKFRDFKTAAPKYDANANAGVAALGTYLCAEGFLRDPSFFDSEQKMVSSKVHHHAMNPYATIQPQDVLSLLFLHEKHYDKHYEIPPVATEEGQEKLRLATRIAKLFNETYKNVPNEERAQFTIGKFNYLIGFGLLDKSPESLGFVELANRSKDMHEVKEAARAIRGGKDAKDVFAGYDIDISALAKPEKDDKSAASDVGQRRFTDHIRPKSHQEFAAQTSSSQRLGA